MTIVYRVQHVCASRNHGPYSYGLVADPKCGFDPWAGPLAGDCTSSGHPSPERDGMPDHYGTGRLFGFQSLQALKEWFDKPRRAWLDGEGFLVEVYEASGVWYGDSGQVSFPPGRAKNMMTPINLTELED